MTKACKEQRPLLCDISDEESRASPRVQGRDRHTHHGERTRVHVKGAALIIKHWPDHVSSLLTYWWIGFGMIAVTIFIVYNCVAFIDVASSHRAPVYVRKANNENSPRPMSDNPDWLDVFMHVVVEQDEETYMDYYLKYVKILSRKYKEYNYHYVAITNDVNKTSVSVESNNDNAINTILTTKNIYRNEYWNGISVKYGSLTNSLDNSPVKEYWRQLSLELQEFLLRCLAIWNNGGIAFHPYIITAKSPNSLYIEKLHNTLRKYKKSKRYKHKHKVNKSFPSEKKKTTFKVNNIRDIINNLQNDTKTEDDRSPEYSLSVADNKEIIYEMNMSKINEAAERKKSEENESINHASNENNLEDNKSEENFRSNISDQILSYEIDNHLAHDANIKYSTLLDILKFNSSYKTQPGDKHIDIDIESKNSLEYNKKTETQSKSVSKPANKHQLVPELIIDLKGLFIATKTSCHAFIGTIFNNVRHYSHNSSVGDVISTELKLFCKGMSSSCKFIDVIM